MKAAVISLGSTSSQWTIDEMKNHFELVDKLYLNRIGVKIGKEGLKLSYRDTPLPDYDCVYVKGSYRYPLLLRSVTEAFYGKSYTPIRPEVFTTGHDKWLSHLVLQRTKVPMPETYLSSTVEEAKSILNQMKYPIIMKFPHGTQGKGVLYSESFAAASSTLDALSILNQPVIIQEYIETEGVDIRTIVCGDDVVASMKRIAVRGEKRANIHAGGTGEEHIPDERTKRVAVNTAKTLGADICAVDILESGRGPKVIEVNLSPGLQGITKATGVNVAAKIAKYLYKQTVRFKEENKVLTKDILREAGISSGEKIQDIITSIDMRGRRILLPEAVTKITNFNEKDEYVIKFENGELKIKPF